MSVTVGEALIAGSIIEAARRLLGELDAAGIAAGPTHPFSIDITKIHGPALRVRTLLETWDRYQADLLRIAAEDPDR